MGLYRDNGLLVDNKATSQKTDKIRKKIIKAFEDNGFSNDIVTNLVEVNFSDATFNLRNGSTDLVKSRIMVLSISMPCPTNHPTF